MGAICTTAHRRYAAHPVVAISSTHRVIIAIPWGVLELLFSTSVSSWERRCLRRGPGRQEHDGLGNVAEWKEVTSKSKSGLNRADNPDEAIFPAKG